MRVYFGGVLHGIYYKRCTTGGVLQGVYFRGCALVGVPTDLSTEWRRDCGSFKAL